MRSPSRLLVAGSALLIISGCGENRVKLDVARSVSENAATSMTRAAAYFDEVETQRRLAAASFVASDPSCDPKRPVQAQRRTPRAKKTAPLCPSGSVADQGYALYSMSFGTTPHDVLKARLLMISAVADYGRALAKIANEEGTDISAELTSFAEKVDRVGSLLSLITGDQGVTAGGLLDSDEGKSIVALGQFVHDLAREADQVERVVARVKMDGDKVDAALVDLKQEVLIRAQGTSTSASYITRDTLREAYRKQRHGMTFNERRAMVLEIFEAEDSEAQIPEKARVVANALEETLKGQQGLRRALNNEFSPSQRRKIAAENLDRITKAMKMVASIGLAFA